MHNNAPAFFCQKNISSISGQNSEVCEWFTVTKMFIYFCVWTAVSKSWETAIVYKLVNKILETVLSMSYLSPDTCMHKLVAWSPPS